MSASSKQSTFSVSIRIEINTNNNAEPPCFLSLVIDDQYDAEQCDMWKKETEKIFGPIHHFQCLSGSVKNSGFLPYSQLIEGVKWLKSAHHLRGKMIKEGTVIFIPTQRKFHWNHQKQIEGIFSSLLGEKENLSMQGEIFLLCNDKERQDKIYFPIMETSNSLPLENLFEPTIPSLPKEIWDYDISNMDKLNLPKEQKVVVFNLLDKIQEYTEPTNFVFLNGIVELSWEEKIYILAQKDVVSVITLNSSNPPSKFPHPETTLYDYNDQGQVEQFFNFIKNSLPSLLEKIKLDDS